MQYLDDHMDDLFQKAAEKYPLKTNVEDFDKVLPFITSTPVAGAVDANLSSPRKWRSLLILLLVIGGSMVSYFIFNTSPVNKKTTVNTKTILPQAKNNTQQVPVRNSSLSQPIKSIGIDNKFLFSETKNTTTPDFINTKTNLAKQISFINIDNNNPDFSIPRPFFFSYPSTLKNISNSKNEITLLNISAQPSPLLSSSKDKRGLKKSFIYYGIKTGLAWNQIKNQGTTQPGLNGGFILGWQLNKQFSLETGIEITQKKYYTHGKYFNPKTGAMPANMEVMSLNGTSNLIEIPAQVKFNFSRKTNTVYGTAGISTYIMTRESNKYKARVSGQVEHINSTYNDAQTYTAAEINLGFGYQRKLSKKIKIRIEPYIQIPLKGIGIGALPVTSTGVHLVLIKK